jgi:hypothetical protein
VIYILQDIEKILYNNILLQNFVLFIVQKVKNIVKFTYIFTSKINPKSRFTSIRTYVRKSMIAMDIYVKWNFFVTYTYVFTWLRTCTWYVRVRGAVRSPGPRRINLAYLKLICVKGQTSLFLEEVKFITVLELQELTLEHVTEHIKWIGKIMCLFPHMFVNRGVLKGEFRWPPLAFIYFD